MPVILCVNFLFLGLAYLSLANRTPPFPRMKQIPPASHQTRIRLALCENSRPPIMILPPTLINACVYVRTFFSRFPTCAIAPREQTESDLQRAYTAPKSSATGNNGSYWWLQNTPESTSVEASSAQLLQTPGAKTSTAIDTPQPHPSKTPSPPPIQESLSVSALKEDRQNRQSPLLDVPRHNDIPRHDVTSRDNALRDSAEPTQPVQPDAHHESAPASEAAGDPEAEGEAGKLPEVPRMFVAPEHITEMAEVAEGARVKATRADGKGDERGTVRYKGELGGGQQVWVGVHFDRPVGDCAGIWGEREYFRCPPQHGCFLPTQFVRPLSVVEAREEAEEKEKGSAALGRDNDPDSTATLSVVRCTHC